jgi:cytochrome c oxidase subunit IV
MREQQYVWDSNNNNNKENNEVLDKQHKINDTIEYLTAYNVITNVNGEISDKRFPGKYIYYSILLFFLLYNNIIAKPFIIIKIELLLLSNNILVKPIVIITIVIITALNTDNISLFNIINYICEIIVILQYTNYNNNKGWNVQDYFMTLQK